MVQTVSKDSDVRMVYDTPRKFTDLATHRTAGFIREMVRFNTPLSTLAASCYLQGAEDMAKAIDRPKAVVQWKEGAD